MPIQKVNVVRYLDDCSNEHATPAAAHAANIKDALTNQFGMTDAQAEKFIRHVEMDLDPFWRDFREEIDALRKSADAD